MLSADKLSQQLRASALELTAALAPILAAPQDFDSQTIYDRIEFAQTRCLSQLASTGIWGRANQLPSSEFWGIAGGTLARGPLQSHAREKPRGYSGDFEMLHRITNNILGEGKIEREFDRFFLRQAAPRAVRSRTQIVAQAITDAVRSTLATVHIVSVGSGPAGDVSLALSQMNENEQSRLRVTLLDVDPQALDFARSRLQEHAVMDGRICYERVNLFRLPGNRGLSKSLSGAQLVFCTGLFDYLDDTGAGQMLQFLESLVATDGRLMVFNFGPENSSRAYMEWIGNWYLIYRTRQDLENLSVGARLTDFEIREDETGFDYYVNLRKL